jgi:hypothetical protein
VGGGGGARGEPGARVVRTCAAIMLGCMGVLTRVQIDRTPTFRCYNDLTCIAKGCVLSTEIPCWLWVPTIVYTRVPRSRPDAAESPGGRRCPGGKTASSGSRAPTLLLERQAARTVVVPQPLGCPRSSLVCERRERYMLRFANEPVQYGSG